MMPNPRQFTPRELDQLLEHASALTEMRTLTRYAANPPLPPDRVSIGVHRCPRRGYRRVGSCNHAGLRAKGAWSPTDRT
jgi:hypothetical protein